MQHEFESSTENYFVACSAPGNAYLCKEGTVWKIDEEVVKCLDTVAAKAAGTPSVDAPCCISDRKIPAGKHIFELERPSSDTIDEGTLSGIGEGREGWTKVGQGGRKKSDLISENQTYRLNSMYTYKGDPFIPLSHLVWW